MFLLASFLLTFARGSYAFLKDSMVFYDAGRIMAYLLTAKGDLEIKEIGLKGL